MQRGVFLAHEGGEFLELLALVGVQLRGHFHDNAHDQVAAGGGIERGNALAAQLEGGAALGARGHLEVRLAFERRDRDLAPEGRGAEADGHFAKQIAFFALENLVLLDVDDHVEVAGRAAAQARFAVAHGAQPRAVLDAGGNLEFDARRRFRAAFAIALAAGALDDLTGAAAARAGLRDLKKSARTDDLPPAAAIAARDRAGALFGAGPVAHVTGLQLGNFDFLFAPECRFLEADLHIVAQIGTPLLAIAIGFGGRGATEELLEDAAPARATAGAEDFSKDIEGIVKAARCAARGACALSESRVPIAVISGAFAVVHEDVIGLAEFLEFFFRRMVSRVFVGMKSYRELAVGAFDFLARGGASDFQNFVIIAF